MNQFTGIVASNILFSLGWILIAWTNRSGFAAVLIGTTLALIWVGHWFAISQLFGDLISQGPVDARTAAMWNLGTCAAAFIPAALAAVLTSRRVHPNARVVFLFIFVWSGGLIVTPLLISGFHGWFTAQWIVIVAFGAMILALPFTRRRVGEG